MGHLLDAFSGWVVRDVAGDKLLLQTGASGLATTSVNFAHVLPDCAGPRYLYNLNGAGLAFYAQFASGRLLYTKIVDPGYQVNLAIASFEQMAEGQDLSTPGVCSNVSNTSGSIGVAENVPAGELNSLVTPLRLE